MKVDALAKMASANTRDRSCDLFLALFVCFIAALAR